MSNARLTRLYLCLFDVGVGEQARCTYCNRRPKKTLHFKNTQINLIPSKIKILIEENTSTMTLHELESETAVQAFTSDNKCSVVCFSATW